MDAYMLNNQIAFEKANALTQEIINTWNTSLSKLGIVVLTTLYQTPRMQQKSLAASIHTSPNSLSNIINKLEKIHPSLLKSERIGRSTYYSLTELAGLYVARELLSGTTTKIHAFISPSYEDSLINETLNLLHQFQSAAGSEWFLIFDELLSNQFNKDFANEMLLPVYQNLINNLKQLKIKKRNDAISKIFDAINNNILIRKLEKYLENELENYFELEPLFDLEKSNLQKAILLINYAFSQLRPIIFKSHETEYIFNLLPITKEQYYAIYHRLSIMLNDFSNYQGNTMKAVEDWENLYYTSNSSLYHIAEKCYTVYLFERK